MKMMIHVLLHPCRYALKHPLYITKSVQGEFEKMIVLKGAICFLYCLIGKQKREVGRQLNGKID